MILGIFAFLNKNGFETNFKKTSLSGRKAKSEFWRGIIFYTSCCDMQNFKVRNTDLLQEATEIF